MYFSRSNALDVVVRAVEENGQQCIRNWQTNELLSDLGYPLQFLCAIVSSTQTIIIDYHGPHYYNDKSPYYEQCNRTYQHKKEWCAQNNIPFLIVDNFDIERIKMDSKSLNELLARVLE